MSRKELYEQAIENSAVSWCQLYREEKTKREELEAKYNALTATIRKKGKDKVNEADNFLFGYWS